MEAVQGERYHLLHGSLTIAFLTQTIMAFV
jgi:hypothetical protein